jgi:hypothetical protein
MKNKTEEWRTEDLDNFEGCIIVGVAMAVLIGCAVVGLGALIGIAGI